MEDFDGEESGEDRVASFFGVGDERVKNKKKREIEQPRYDWDGGDFGVYMKEKQRKLHDQFAAQFKPSDPVVKEGNQSQDATRSSTFMHGVHLHVSGWTQPSRETLRELIIKAGGEYHTYYSTKSVTHFVATSLSHARMKSLNEGPKIFIVNPDWVVDSIQQQRRLPEAKYRINLGTDSRQHTLAFHTSTLQSPTKEKNKADAFPEANEDEVDVQDELIVDDTNNDAAIKLDAMRRSGKLLSTSENVNFVKDFFAQSRLHFIGSFRARYEQLMENVAERLGMKSGNALLQDSVTCQEQGEHMFVERIVLHIDMDAFFASCAISVDPSLRGHPVVVCHSSSTSSHAVTSRGEISAANYEARSYGIRAGMFLKTALQMCPHVKSVPYDFELYEKVATKVITLLHAFARLVEVRSVDEAYIDLTGQDTWPVRGKEMKEVKPLKTKSDVDEFCRELRNRIEAETGCTASIGIGSNKLAARLATKKAKPNGIYRILPDETESFVAQLKIRDLPGIGYRTCEKLETELRVKTTEQLRKLSKTALQNVFGANAGVLIYECVRGRSNEKVIPLAARKSISATVGWGVRFGAGDTEYNKAVRFVVSLAEEVADRARQADAVGSRVSVELLKAKSNAGEPYKLLGQGSCDRIRSSASILFAHNQESLRNELTKVCERLFRESRLLATDFRGISIHLGDLRFGVARSLLPGQNSSTGASVLELMKKTSKVNGGLDEARIDRVSKGKTNSKIAPNEQEVTVIRPQDTVKAVDAVLPEVISERNGARLQLNERKTNDIELKPIDEDNPRHGRTAKRRIVVRPHDYATSDVFKKDRRITLVDIARVNEAKKYGIGCLGAETFQSLSIAESLALIREIELNEQLRASQPFPIIPRDNDRRPVLSKNSMKAPKENDTSARLHQTSANQFVSENQNSRFNLEEDFYIVQRSLFRWISECTCECNEKSNCIEKLRFALNSVIDVDDDECTSMQSCARVEGLVGIREYMHSLLTSAKLYHLFKILRSVRFCIERKGTQAFLWNALFDLLLKDIQSHVLEVFGYQLDIVPFEKLECK